MELLSFGHFKESAQDIRNFIKSNPKFSEKGKDLDSGGKLEDNISNIFVEILSQIKKEMPELQVTATSGNDRFHKGLSGGSKHKEGKAIDFVISPYNTSYAEKVKNILDQFASGNKGFAYLDEYTRPSSAATGGHFHISYDPYSPEGTHARKLSNISPMKFNFDKSAFGIKPSSYNSYNEPKPSLDTWAGLIQRLQDKY